MDRYSKITNKKSRGEDSVLFKGISMYMGEMQILRLYRG